MKRRISLLLAVVMILGTFSFAFAADVNEKVDLVTKEGILRGDQGTNALRLDDPLARKEAVVLLSRLMDVEEEANNFEKEGLPTFSDVQDAVYYKSFIAWAEDNKYFDGNPDGTFGFNDNLTVKQYAAVLLRALGYAEEVYNVEGWKNVEKLANDFNLLEDVETELNGDATRREVAVMTFNALGAKMKDSDKTLAEFLGIEMPAPAELKVEVKDTENLKEVVLELSNAKLVDKDKLENANNYKVAGNVVEKAELDGNNVIVLLRDALKEGREYKLRVRGIDKAINKEYKFVAKDNTIPSVEKVEVLGEYGIKVVVNEPINIKDGNRGRNFVVDGKNIAMNVESYGRNIILTPYYKESFSENSKTLTITGLEDFAGFKSAREEFNIEVVKDDVAPEVVDVITRGNNKVEVVFDKDIYIESVEDYYDRNNTGNISYVSGRHTVYANDAKKIDTNRAVYTFEDDLLLRRRTEFTIEGVQNHSKVTMKKVTMEAREVLDDAEPEIIEHKITKKDVDKGTATIKLYFDKDVAGSFKKKDNEKFGFEPKDHFRLYEREVYKRNEVEGRIESAEYDVDAKGNLVKDVVVVKLEKLEGWTTKNELDYILEVEDFTDAASKRNRMFRDYVEFRITKTTGFFIKDIVVDEGKYETEITIKFSKPVDRVIAEDPTNYIFRNTDKARRDVKDLKGKIVTERKGTEVTLILPDFKVKDYDTLTIYDLLKDKDGNRLDKVYTYEFGKVFDDTVEKANTLLKEAKDYADNEAVAKAVKKLETLKEAGYREVDREEILDAIEALEKALEEVKKEDKDKTEEAVKKVEEKINELPKLNEIKLTDKKAVEAARKAYDEDLTEAQKAQVSEAALAKLIAAEARIAELEEEKGAVDTALKDINDAESGSNYAGLKTAIEKNAKTLGLDLADYNTFVEGRKNAVANDLFNNKPAGGYTVETLKPMFDEIVATRLVFQESVALFKKGMEDVEYIQILIDNLNGVKHHKVHSEKSIANTILPELRTLVEKFEALEGKVVKVENEEEEVVDAQEYVLSKIDYNKNTSSTQTRNALREALTNVNAVEPTEPTPEP